LGHYVRHLPVISGPQRVSRSHVIGSHQPARGLLPSWSCRLVAKPPVTLQRRPSRDTRAEAARGAAHAILGNCAYGDPERQLLRWRPTNPHRGRGDPAHAPGATHVRVSGRGSALTRKRPLVRTQYRPPAAPWSGRVSAAWLPNSRAQHPGRFTNPAYLGDREGGCP
jgi:hypothetical protein